MQCKKTTAPQYSLTIISTHWVMNTLLCDGVLVYCENHSMPQFAYDWPQLVEQDIY